MSTISTYAGNNMAGYGGDLGNPLAANIDFGYSVAVDQSSGDLFIADSNDHCIRKVIASQNEIATVIGNGTAGNFGDGVLAGSATLHAPLGVFVNPKNGNLFIADTMNHIIRVLVKSTNRVFTIAGNGDPSYYGDGAAATSGALQQPFGVSYHSISGNIYIADTLNNCIRWVDSSTGFIYTAAGMSLFGYSGDGGFAANALLNNPTCVNPDQKTGDLYIADQQNHCIRMISYSTGLIETIAGVGAAGYSGDGGSAVGAMLNSPTSVIIDDNTRDIYIADSLNNCIRRIWRENGIINTIAGSLSSGYSGDGDLAIYATFSQPSGLTIISNSSTLFVADLLNYVIRKIDAVGYHENPTSQPTSQPISFPTGSPSCFPTGSPSSYPTIFPTGSPTNDPSSRPSHFPSNHPSSMPSNGPSTTPSSCPTCFPSSSPSNRPSIIPSSQPSSGPTRLPSSFPSNWPSSLPSSQPSISPTRIPSRVPSSLPSTSPTEWPSSRPSNHPSTIPSSQPSISPSRIPSTVPSCFPSSFPTQSPSSQPSVQPSTIPSSQPSISPTQMPSTIPSAFPSSFPTQSPSSQPSNHPSSLPSSQPSIFPTQMPSTLPTCSPSLSPSTQPSSSPSRLPSTIPTSQPSMIPSSSPSDLPSLYPTALPSSQPSNRPSWSPSSLPSVQPSISPTRLPSSGPSAIPSQIPSSQPSSLPTLLPSRLPTSQPSKTPSSQPSRCPTHDPSSVPSCFPSLSPSSQPSICPSRHPSSLPSQCPSSIPSCQPSSYPSGCPSCVPSSQPSSQPSLPPSSSPTDVPSISPSGSPSRTPSSQPSTYPTQMPSSLPSSQPFSLPTHFPTDIPSGCPSSLPSCDPSTSPSHYPSAYPTHFPTSIPSFSPSSQPISLPSSVPSHEPSNLPTMTPSLGPSSGPSSQPSDCPSILPSCTPSSIPSTVPSRYPSSYPTYQPVSIPSSKPSSQPSMCPSTPSSYPSMIPVTMPTSPPSRIPSCFPSNSPSSQPSDQPSRQPSGCPTTVPLAFPSSTPTAYPTSSPSEILREWNVFVDTTLDLSLKNHSIVDIDNRCLLFPSPSFSLLDGSCSLRIALDYCLFRVPWSNSLVQRCRIYLPGSVEIWLSHGSLLIPSADELHAVGMFRKLEIVGDGQGSMIINARNMSMLNVSNSFLRIVDSSSSVNATILRQWYMNSEIVLHKLTLVGFGRREESISLGYEPAMDICYIQSFSLIDVTLLDNHGWNGSVMASSIGKSNLVGLTCRGNSAWNGGCLFLSDVEEVTMSNMRCDNNKAGNLGGCMTLFSIERVNISLMTCNSNIAVMYGGCIAASHISDSFVLLNSDWNNNTARYGSALMLSNITFSALENNHFQKNHAFVAGTVFWIHSSHMPHPILINNSYLSNVAIYGPNIATEPVQLSAFPSSIMVTNYLSGSFVSPVLVSIVDGYQQTVSYLNDSPMACKVSETAKFRYTCDINTPTVFGNTQETLMAGKALFSSLGVRCIPGGFTNISFASVLKIDDLRFPQFDVSLVGSEYRYFALDVLTTFRPCEVGEVFDYFSTTKSTCSVCYPGYSLKDNADRSVVRCTDCPQGAQYCYSNQIYLSPGTWRWDLRSSAILSCPYSKNCLGRNQTGESSCLFPSFGPLCGLCQDHYYLDVVSSSCRHCEYVSNNLLLLVVIGVGLFLVILAYLWKFLSRKMIEYYTELRSSLTIEPTTDNVDTHNTDNKKSSLLVSRGKILLSTYQIVFQNSYGSFQFPTMFSKFRSTFSVVNFDMSGIIPLSCFLHYDYLSYMFWATTFPLAVIGCMLLMLGFVFAILYLVMIFSSRSVTTMVIRRIALWFVRIIVVAFYIGLPSISTIIFNVFRCVDIDPHLEVSFTPHSYLLADFSIQCESLVYLKYRNWAALMIFVYPIGVTCFFWYLLYNCRYEIIQRENIQKALSSKTIVCRTEKLNKDVASARLFHYIGFLYNSYASKCWYWEIVELFRRLLLASILTVFVSIQSIQLICFMFVSLVFIKLYQRYSPFASVTENILGEIGQYQILGTYFITSILYHNSIPMLRGQYSLDLMLIFMNSLSVAMNLYYNWMDYLNEDDLVQKAKISEIEIQNMDIFYEDLNFSRQHDLTMFPILLKNMENKAILCIHSIVVNHMMKRALFPSYRERYFVDMAYRKRSALHSGVEVMNSLDRIRNVRRLRSTSATINAIQCIDLPVHPVLLDRMMFVFPSLASSQENRIQILRSDISYNQWKMEMADDDYYSLSSSEESYSDDDDEDEEIG